MNRLGIGRAAEASAGTHPTGLERIEKPEAIWAYANEISKGKDTQSGHWELAGLPVPFAWGYFPDTVPAFPPELTERLIREAKLPGILADRHAPGTTVIEDYGEEHIRTGKPICYTSVDSVLQIAAHEERFGLERLYETCRVARKLCDRCASAG
jgi:phosphopentomutase